MAKMLMTEEMGQKIVDAISNTETIQQAKAEIDAHAEEVLKSLPETYDVVLNDVSELKSDLSKVSGSFNEVQSNVVVNTDTIFSGTMTLKAGSGNTIKSTNLEEFNTSIGEYIYLYVFAEKDISMRPYIICKNIAEDGTVTNVEQVYNIDHGRWSWICIRVPENTTNMDFGCRNNETEDINAKYFITKNVLEFNHLYGRSILAFGTSITYGSNNTIGSVAKSYISVIAERNKMTLHNYARSGSTLVKSYKDAEKTNARGCIYEHVTNAIIEENSDFPDIIIMSGGFNDASANYHDYSDERLPSELGSFEENDFSGNYDTSTVIGTIEKIFYRLKENFYWHSSSANWIRIPKLVYALEYYEIVTPTWTTYRKVIKQVCEKWGVPCIDMNEILQALNGSTFGLKPLVYTDGTHLDSKSQVMLANGFEQKLKNIYF